MAEYRVNLEIYNGPLDLLLYLIRREELDVYDIPIAEITDQYVRYVELLKQLDPNLAGDFLVMAAALIEIKTRMLLPAPPPEEGGADGLEIDPRAELIRQLLEYKAFKDAAGDLREAAAARALRHAHRPAGEPAGEDEPVDLEDVQVWDLVEALGKLLAAIGQGPAAHEIIYDDTPIELYQTDLLDRLQRDGAMTFTQLFEGRDARIEVLGLFLALLELVRLKRVLASQSRNFGEIHIDVNPDFVEQPAAEAEAPLPAAPAPAAAAAPAGAEAEAPAELGQYVSEDADSKEPSHGPAREASEAGP